MVPVRHARGTTPDGTTDLCTHHHVRAVASEAAASAEAAEVEASEAVAEEVAAVAATSEGGSFWFLVFGF